MKFTFAAFVTVVLSVSPWMEGPCHPGEPSSAVEAYVEFLHQPHETAADYVLSLFEDHNIVIICERAHPEKTQYDLFLEIARDPRFSRDVGVIFTEVGSRNYGPQIDSIVFQQRFEDSLAYRRLRDLYRDFTAEPVWDYGNFLWFLRQLTLQNRSMPDSLRTRVIPSDLPFVWTEDNKGVPLTQDSSKSRDAGIAEYIIDQSMNLKQTYGREKALVIMNYRHAFNNFTAPDSRRNDNVGRYLFDAFPGLTANVMLNTPIAKRNGRSYVFSGIQDGKWDAAFDLLGDPSIGFDFAGTPFGDDSCDYIYYMPHTLKYEDVFDGLVYWRPNEDHELWLGLDDVIDSSFVQTLYARIESLNAFESNEEMSAYVDFVRTLHVSSYEQFDQYPILPSVECTFLQDEAQWLSK